MIRLRFGIWLALVLLQGCASNTPVPEDRFYQLDTGSSAVTLPVPALRGGLNIDYVSSDPLRSGRAVIYRETSRPLELQRYRYEFWVDQPPRMVHRALVQYLRDSGVADTVTDSSDRAETAYLLRARLTRFEQVIGAGSPGVEVELEISLFSGDGDVLKWTKVYLQRSNSDGREMHAAAHAMQEALEEIFRSLVGDLASRDDKHR